jgi:hypothetical protein
MSANAFLRTCLCRAAQLNTLREAASQSSRTVRADRLSGHQSRDPRACGILCDPSGPNAGKVSLHLQKDCERAHMHRRLTPDPR